MIFREVDMSVERPARLRRRSRSAGAAAALVVLWMILTLPAGGGGGFPQDKGLQHQVDVSFKLIHVYVTHRNGEPVDDLTIEDFELRDNGRLQKIVHFEKHFREIQRPSAGVPAVLPTNRKFFLVFDFAFMDPRGVFKARDAALKFLDTEMRPTDEIGMVTYTATRGLVLREYLTTDHDHIRRLVESIGLSYHTGRAESLTDFIYYTDIDDMEREKKPSDGSSGAPPKMPDTEFYLKQAIRQTSQTLQDGRRESYVNRAREFILSLRELARVFRLIPGFKNVILFSGGFHSQLIFGKRGGAVVGHWKTPEQFAAELSAYDAAQADTGLQTDYSEMLQDFAAANAPVFAVDATRAIRNSDISSPEGFDPTAREFEGADSLKQFASATGGKFYANTVENRRIASDIQTLTGAYYVLGYDVDNAWDGKYHKIRVNVKRKGLRVVSQGGYFASRPFLDYSAFEKLLHVVDLALSDIPQVQVPFEIPVAGIPVLSEGRLQLLVFGRLDRDAAEEVLGGNSEAYLLIFNEDGGFSNIEKFKLAVPGPGAKTLYPSFLMTVKPGSAGCRLVIRNQETGRGARGVVPLIVPDSGSSGFIMDAPFLLMPSADSLEMAATPGSSPSEIFGYDRNLYAPLLGDIPEDVDTLYAVVRLSGLSSAADLEIDVSRGDPVSYEWTDLPVSVVKKKQDERGVDLLVEIALEGSPHSGRYILEFLALDKHTGDTASVSVDIVRK
jgi:VWFA-related protein